ncbi:MAG: hypothetical protein P4L64_13955 [Caulobacteraceae bacterium]|nr:hypothetical protein [Caulobacteraceae bacterium]
MTKMRSATAILVLGLTLSACASQPKPPPPPPTVWIGGDPAHLAADQAQCKKESAELDVNQSAAYSDPRYGAAVALAAQVRRDNPLSDQTANIRAAVFAACMNDKGWKPQ